MGEASLRAAPEKFRRCSRCRRARLRLAGRGGRVAPALRAALPSWSAWAQTRCCCAPPAPSAPSVLSAPALPLLSSLFAPGRGGKKMTAGGACSPCASALRATWAARKRSAVASFGVRKTTAGSQSVLQEVGEVALGSGHVAEARRRSEAQGRQLGDEELGSVLGDDQRPCSGFEPEPLQGGGQRFRLCSCLAP